MGTKRETVTLHEKKKKKKKKKNERRVPNNK